MKLSFVNINLKLKYHCEYFILNKIETEMLTKK